MRQRSRMWFMASTVACATALAGCSTGSNSEGADSGTTLRIATVDNRDVVRMQELSAAFEEQNPDIALDWVSLDENQLRQRVMTDISTDGGQFDIVMIGTYEAPIWAEREWLVPIEGMSAGYDEGDLLPQIREALSYEDTLYAAPFYGESAFTMYRTDLLDEAGIDMPDEPTWDDITAAAGEINDPDEDIYGICLRGKPGWGENIGLVTAMANSYGARWFDQDWQPRLDSPEWEAAVTEYVALLDDYGPPGAETLGYTENLELFQQGKCGIWIDATVAASALTDPDDSEVADTVGFAMAPGTGLDRISNWLWSWALAIPESSTHIDEAKAFVSWATSQEYTDLVAQEDGWANVPPGTRTSLYENQEYLAAAPFADMVLSSIEAANPENPTVDPVPYTGIQYVSIPAFPSIGTAVGDRIATAVAGEISPLQALQDSQWATEKVMAQSEVAAEDD